VYSLRALGPVGSFVCTWSLVLGYVGVVVFEVIALPSALAYIVPGFNVLELWSVAGEPVYASWILVGGIGAIVMTALNYRGVETAAQFQTILTLVIALAGIMLAVGAVLNGQSQPNPPLSDVGATGVATVAIMTPFMFVGFDVIPQSAEGSGRAPRLIGLLIPASVTLAACFTSASSGRPDGRRCLAPHSSRARCPPPQRWKRSSTANLSAALWPWRIAGVPRAFSFLLGASRASSHSLTQDDSKQISTVHP